MSPHKMIDLLSERIEQLKNELESALSQAESYKAALTQIAAIKDEQYGGDWDEIEQARLIAITALAASQAVKTEGQK